MRTNELQQIIAPQREDGILMASTDAGTGQLTMARAAEFFGAELIKPTNSVGASLSQKVEKEPMTWYDLPMPEGWAGNGLKYGRNQMGTVFLSMYASTGVSPGITDFKIGVLPEGFRPEFLIVGMAIDVSKASILTIVVHPNGNIVLRPYLGDWKDDWRSVRGNIVFQAYSQSL